jgi:hypothetical protein
MAAALVDVTDEDHVVNPDSRKYHSRAMKHFGTQKFLLDIKKRHNPAGVLCEAVLKFARKRGHQIYQEAVCVSATERFRTKSCCSSCTFTKISGFEIAVC